MAGLTSTRSQLRLCRCLRAPNAALTSRTLGTPSRWRLADNSGRPTATTIRPITFGTTVTATSGIRIVKAINAVDPGKPTVQEDANSADLPVILATRVRYEYTFLVTNLGTNALKDIVITDELRHRPAG